MYTTLNNQAQVPKLIKTLYATVILLLHIRMAEEFTLLDKSYYNKR